MAKIDINAVLDGHDSPRVGDLYEVAQGKWGKMKYPTIALQEDAFALAEGGEISDLDFARLVLDGLPEFDDKDAISGMPEKVAGDFFTLVVRIAEKVSPASSPSGQ